MTLTLSQIIAIIIVIIVAIAFAVFMIVRIKRTPTEEQISMVKEWLLWAVTEAERLLGGGTGKLKLRMVYDLFIVRFPWLVKLISFERFEALVDEVLVDMRKLLETNHAVKAFVGGIIDGN